MLAIYGWVANGAKKHKSLRRRLSASINPVDGNKCCVRERNRLQEAADLLAKTKTKCKGLVNYVRDKNIHNKKM